MPPKYKFENVVCCICLLKLLINVGVYANSKDADQGPELQPLLKVKVDLNQQTYFF